MQLPEHHNVIEYKLLNLFKSPFTPKFNGVVIQDGICGVGKTMSAMEHMKRLLTSNPHSRVIYVGIYKEELHRVAGTTMDPKYKDGRAIMKDAKILYTKNGMAGFQFQHPYRIRGKNKLRHLEELITQNCNIVITHKLFSHFDLHIINLLKIKNYHLIIDEEPTVIESVEDRYIIEYSPRLGESYVIDKYTLEQENIRELEQINVLQVNQKTNLLEWKGPDLLRYRDVIEDVKNGHLDFYTESNKKQFIWRFNPEVFTCFKTIHLLTYLFRGSIFNAYLDIHKIPYLIQDLTEESIFHYRRNDAGRKEEIIKPIHRLITLAKTRTSYLTQLKTPHGGFHKPFSSGYFDAFLSDNKLIESSPIKNALSNYFKSKHPTKGRAPIGDEKMWTTITKARESLEDAGYIGNFVAFNKRATNDHRRADFLAFVYHPFLMPVIPKYVKWKKSSISENAFATSILVQWVFRSAIRDGKPIKLFIASELMHNLFVAWLKKFEMAYEDRIEIRDTDEALIRQLSIPMPQNITIDEFYKIQPGLMHVKGINALINKL